VILTGYYLKGCPFGQPFLRKSPAKVLPVKALHMLPFLITRKRALTPPEVSLQVAGQSPAYVNFLNHSQAGAHTAGSRASMRCSQGMAY